MQIPSTQYNIAGVAGHRLSSDKRSEQAHAASNNRTGASKDSGQAISGEYHAITTDVSQAVVTRIQETAKPYNRLAHLKSLADMDPNAKRALASYHEVETLPDTQATSHLLGLNIYV